MNKITTVGIALLVSATGVSADILTDSYSCEVRRFDLHPENKINILAPYKSVIAMQVASDRKTLLSKGSIYDIKKMYIEGNMNAYRIDAGTIWIDAIGKNGQHSGAYIKNGNKNGVLYNCKKVDLIEK